MVGEPTRGSDSDTSDDESAGCRESTDSDARSEDALHQSSVGLGERAMDQSSFPEQPNEVKPLLGFFFAVVFRVQRRAVIQLKALEIARELNITGFKASLGWCSRMMRRNGLALSRRTSLAQHLPSDFGEKLLSFQRFVINLRKKHSYPLDQIGNADQTPVYFDMPTSVTVNRKGEKSVLVKSTGNEKSRVTVMLTCLADGSKLPPHVILKRKTVPKHPMPAGIIVRAQEKGWMETELVVDWLKVVWGARYGGLRKRRNMLVLDAFRGHLTEPVKSQVRAMNGDLVIIPGGMTSQLQVLDVVVNKPFKDNLRKKYRVAPVWQPRTHTDRENPEAVSPSTSIIRGFKKCCISNALDGSEDDALWEEPVEAEQLGSDDSESEHSGDEDVCEG
ncbi:Pogo transposable element with KRAB domain [Merluccius polli]|uniref:Pogo transposable element with KRAB domain n=1 Tax=Merluccius polli TaxID=89951 RepID=A0AA47PBE4_MERPO|nr:Pogo transposable element with KRAB domain [Merluccius polli]